MTIDAPLLAVVGGSTGAGKSTLVNSLVGTAGHRAGRAAADHALAGAGAPPRRRRVVRRRTGCCPTSSGSHRATTDPDALQLVALDERPRGAGHPRRPRHRLGRGAQPHPRRPAARRGRPVAVRHLGRALRRPGAVGLPAPGRRALRRGRDRARPHPARGRRDRLHPPRPDARQPRAQGLAAVRGHRGRRSTTTGCCRPRRSPRSAAGWTRSPPTPRPATMVVRQTLDGAIRTLARRTHAVADAADEQAAACAAAARGRRHGVRRRDHRRSTRPRPTARCCAARCWPAGRSSSAPASC